MDNFYLKRNHNFVVVHFPSGKEWIQSSVHHESWNVWIYFIEFIMSFDSFVWLALPIHNQMLQKLIFFCVSKLVSLSSVCFQFRILCLNLLFLLGLSACGTGLSQRSFLSREVLFLCCQFLAFKENQFPICQRADSLEKILMLGKIEGKRRGGSRG